MGSVGVSPAVFGVPPKTFRGMSQMVRDFTRFESVGETPTGETETVALPNKNARSRFTASGVIARFAAAQFFVSRSGFSNEASPRFTSAQAHQICTLAMSCTYSGTT